MPAINLDLISPTRNDIKYLGEVKALSSLDSTGNGFDPEGLYSVEIFSVSGSEARSLRFGFIDIKFKIIHPKIFEAITSLSKLYLKIMEGSVFVKFDIKEKDFVIDDEGETGYQYFLDHLDKIKFKRTSSKKRDLKIEMIYKFLKEDKITYKNLLVLPAGLRDYEVTRDGRVSEDEINDLYRAVLRDKNLIGSIEVSKDELKMIDPIRIKLQKDINNIYDYIKRLLDGKHKFIRGSWIKRGVDYGTRNVFSGLSNTIKDLDNPINAVKPYETVIGILQATNAFLPLVFYKIKNIFLNDIINLNTGTANLVDIKTLKQITVELPKTELDKWGTRDGINSIANRTIDDEIKNTPVLINGYYLKLIYDDGKSIKLIDDIENEADLDTKHIRPITYGEFLFISLYDILKEYPATITRDPVIEEGSTYYTMLQLRSTLPGRTVKFINTDSDFNNYPIIGKSWINTIGLHYSRLDQMGADFDGDTGPLIGYLTKDSAEEAKRKINDISFYVKVTGKPTLDLVDDVIHKTILTLTK